MKHLIFCIAVLFISMSCNAQSATQEVEEIQLPDGVELNFSEKKVVCIFFKGEKFLRVKNGEKTTLFAAPHCCKIGSDLSQGLFACHYSGSGEVTEVEFLSYEEVKLRKL